MSYDITIFSVPKKALPVEERFWPKVDKSGGPDACWPWLAHRAWNGYGEFRLPLKTGKLVKSHRFSYELLHGPTPAGMDLDHKCRNRWCCNPAHLEPVTRSENSLRGLSGDHLRKLSVEDVKIIRILSKTINPTALGKRFGVTRQTIWKIVTKPDRTRLWESPLHPSRLPKSTQQTYRLRRKPSASHLPHPTCCGGIEGH